MARSDCRDEVNLYGNCSRRRILNDATHKAQLDNHTPEKLHRVWFVVSTGAPHGTSLQVAAPGEEPSSLAFSRYGSLAGKSSAEIEFALHRIQPRIGYETVATTAAWTDRDDDPLIDEDIPQEYFDRNCDYIIRVG
jgi:hypothetical protein